jgi:hypothetical protein
MDNKKLFVGAGLIGLGYVIYNQYQNAKELSDSLVFAPENISLDTTYAFAPVLKFTLQITNPSRNTVTLTKIYSTVSLDGNQIGTVNNDTPVLIAGTATTKLTLNLTINSIQLITYLLQIKFSEIPKLNISFEGYYVANSLKLPLSLSFGNKIGYVKSLPKIVNKGQKILIKKYSFPRGSLDLSKPEERGDTYIIVTKFKDKDNIYKAKIDYYNFRQMTAANSKSIEPIKTGLQLTDIVTLPYSNYSIMLYNLVFQGKPSITTKVLFDINVGKKITMK